MPNEICANCDGNKALNSGGSISVPVAFIEAVRKAVDGLDHGGCWCDMAIGNPMVKEHTEACKAMATVRTMLDQIKGA